jgi:hypothetical protein
VGDQQLLVGSSAGAALHVENRETTPFHSDSSAELGRVSP